MFLYYYLVYEKWYYFKYMCFVEYICYDGSVFNFRDGGLIY